MQKKTKQLLLIPAFLLVYSMSVLFFLFRIKQNLNNLQQAVETADLTSIENINKNLKNNLTITSYLSAPLPKVGVLETTNQLVLFSSQLNITITQSFALTDTAETVVKTTLGQNNDNWQKNFNQFSTQIINLNQELEQLIQKTIKLENNFLIKRAGYKEQLVLLKKRLETASQAIKEFEKNKKLIPSFLGQDQKKNYLILLQNNMELRPTGGFMGSYAVASFDQGVMKELKVQDIYAPDGQIAGYIQPPQPVQQAFKLGEWRLRDVNWNPNFPEASQTILWFFDKGGVKNLDGVIAINLNLAKDLLQIVEPINLHDYDEQVTSRNLYRVAQYYAETDFFPGSTQKKDFLSALGNALVFELENLEQKKIPRLGRTFLNKLNNREILLYFEDNHLQSFVDKQNWAGKLTATECQQKGCIKDDFALIEANLGVNKANCCIERQTTHQITTTKQGIKHQIELTITNNNKTNPQPPKTWGGRYKNYLRFYIPEQTEISTVLINNQQVSSREIAIKDTGEGLKSIGFFVEIPPLEEKQISFSYLIPEQPNNNYQLTLHKQTGVQNSPQIINFRTKGVLNGKINTPTTIRSELKTNETFKVSFSRD